VVTTIFVYEILGKDKWSENISWHALYDKIYRPDILWEAWQRVKRKKGSEGVDGVNIIHIMLFVFAFGILLYLLYEEMNSWWF
jgi:hypothetical protein